MQIIGSLLSVADARQAMKVDSGLTTDGRELDPNFERGLLIETSDREDEVPTAERDR